MTAAVPPQPLLHAILLHFNRYYTEDPTEEALHKLSLLTIEKKMSGRGKRKLYLSNTISSNDERRACQSISLDSTR